MLTSTRTSTPLTIPRQQGSAANRPALPARPDPEVPAMPARAGRRQFTAAYKLRIVDEANRTAIGQLGALLRREGLYSSHLANWRRQRAEGSLAALAPHRRGRPVATESDRELAQLRVENARLTHKLAAAEIVIAVQKKVATLLGLIVPPVPEGLEPVTESTPLTRQTGKTAPRRATPRATGKS